MISTKPRHFTPKHDGHVPRDKMPKLNFQYIKWWLKRFPPQKFPNFCKLNFQNDFFFLLTHDFCSRKKEKEKIYQAHVTKLMNHPSENREVQCRTRECRPLPGVAVASFPRCLGARAGALIIQRP